ADKRSNRAIPKLFCGLIRRHDADFPLSRASRPYLMCRSRPHASSSVSPNDEKLRHVPDIFIGGHLRAAPDQSEAGQFVVHSNQEGMPVRFFPIQRKVLELETAIFTELYIDELAEIVLVQLEQIGQHWFALRSRW